MRLNQKQKIQLKFRVKNRDIFDAIVSGRKKVETRAATPKYMKVRVGDVLTLVCGKKRLKKKVKKAEHFKTINAVMKKYRPEEINPKANSLREIRETWYSFPNYREKIKKFGLVLWQLK